MNLAPIGIKFLSQLANNSDSIAPMATKDTISNAAIVYTYKKEGGKDDAREKAIEEFGTGAVWLFAIPAIKKIIDKFIYPLANLKDNLDCRNLTPEFIEKAKNAKNIALDEKQIFESLDKSKIFKYKSAYIAKFAVATAASAVALSAIIKFKQKTTQKRIEKDVQSNHASKALLHNAISKEKLPYSFSSKLKIQNNDKNISFKGNIANLFLYNPIANTSILDGVITTTRLKEARNGEKKEVGLKEGFQIVFIYFLAKPIQAAFEKIGDMIKHPIHLDPTLIFDKDLSKNLADSSDSVKNLLKAVEGSDKKQACEYLKEAIYNLDVVKDKALLELLEKNQVISLVKDKNNIKGISYFNFIKGNDIKKSLEGFEQISKNLNNLKGIKAYKIFAVIANVLLAAWAMGRLQPKINIWMRKVLNNGDNRNPAIIEQEEMLKKQKEAKLQ